MFRETCLQTVILLQGGRAFIVGCCCVSFRYFSCIHCWMSLCVFKIFILYLLLGVAVCLPDICHAILVGCCCVSPIFLSYIYCRMLLCILKIFDMHLLLDAILCLQDIYQAFILGSHCVSPRRNVFVMHLLFNAAVCPEDICHAFIVQCQSVSRRYLSCIYYQNLLAIAPRPTLARHGST